jgi:hypothetical protein
MVQESMSASEILNPFMHITSGGDKKTPTLVAPVKAQGLVVTPAEPRLASLVWRLIVHSRQSASAAIDVSESDRDALRRVGALIPRHALPREISFSPPRDLEEIRNALMDRPVSEAADALQRLGHVKVSDVLPSDHVALMNDYATQIAREGWLEHEASANRYIAHGSLIGRTYHPVVLLLVARIAGRPLVPSFSYLASYLPGASLPRHRDRPQCDYTLSMHLGQEGGGREDWPLLVQRGFDDPSSCAYHCRPGDAVLYRGTRLRHERPVRTSEKLYNQIMWHFVEEGFAEPLN